MQKNQIKLLIMDVDGTLTDGKIYMGENGELFKVFDIKDGCGIHDILSDMNGGVEPIIITGRNSRILDNRCFELNIKYLYQGVRNKLEKLDELLRELSFIDGLKLSYENVAYIGDDTNDLLCMERIHVGGGLVGCPADAVDQVKETADYICALNGGNGAVREFIEWLRYPL